MHTQKFGRLGRGTAQSAEEGRLTENKLWFGSFKLPVVEKASVMGLVKGVWNNLIPSIFSSRGLNCRDADSRERATPQLVGPKASSDEHLMDDK